MKFHIIFFYKVCFVIPKAIIISFVFCTVKRHYLNHCRFTLIPNFYIVNVRKFFI